MTPLASHGPTPRRRGVRYAALGEDFGEGGLPIEGFGMHRRAADDAVALADVVVEAGQALARRGGLGPQAELADFRGVSLKWSARPEVMRSAQCWSLGCEALVCSDRLRKTTWISLLDRKWGFEGGLWVQGRSRVPPDHREGGGRGRLYSGLLMVSAEHRTSNSRSKPAKATSKPPQSVLIARG